MSWPLHDLIWSQQQLKPVCASCARADSTKENNESHWSGLIGNGMHINTMTARLHPLGAAVVMRNNESHWSGITVFYRTRN